MKKDLVILARHWVVEQLDVALEEFKKFRDGLDEKEREKYDKLVEKQNQKWSDYECEDLCFEEMDVIIKEIQKEMDDIIARHNYENKDIDSIVELIQGKQLGAIPKHKKEKIHKNKKKNKDIKSPSLSDNTKMAEKTKEAQLEETKNQLSDNAKIADKLKKTEEVLNVTKTQIEETKNRLSEEKSYEVSLFDNSKIAEEFKKTKETLNITKAQLEQTKNQLREEKSKNDNLNIKNDFLRLKLLHNDFKKYRDVLRQRQKNNLSVIDHLRASPELEHTPQVQLALRSLHEFSALLLLADQQLSSQYDILYQPVSYTHLTLPTILLV